MNKRKYVKIKALEPVILAMREEGKSLGNIARELGLDEKQMRNWSYRHNREQKNEQAGIIYTPNTALLQPFDFCLSVFLDGRNQESRCCSHLTPAEYALR